MSNSVNSLPRIPPWLPIVLQVKTKVLTVVFKVLYELNPSFSKVISHHNPCFLEIKNSIGEMETFGTTYHFNFARLPYRNWLHSLWPWAIHFSSCH